MTLTRRFSTLAAAGVLGICGSANADIIEFEAFMDGLQEVPPVPTPATGNFTVFLDTDTNTVFNASGSYADLIGAVTVAHIHGLAPVGMNASPFVNLNPVTLAITDGVGGAFVITPAQAQGMLDGLTYINVHSDFRPGGEIRGQLTIVPAPGAALLLGIGGLLAARRRR